MAPRKEKVATKKGRPSGTLRGEKYYSVFQLAVEFFEKFPKLLNSREGMVELWKKIKPVLSKEFPDSRATLNTISNYKSKFKKGLTVRIAVKG